MKKNKTSMYVLVPIVIGIWGYIGWKIYDGLKGKDAVNIPALGSAAPATKENVPDTFQLVANYRDPFLGKAEVPHVANTGGTSVKKQDKTPQKPAAPVAAGWPAVTYGGMIQKKQGPPFALVTVAGQSHLVKAGEKAGDVVVLSVSRDSIQVGWGKERRYFRK